MINEHILKISSAGVNIPEEMERGMRYLITTEIDITEVTEKDNNDDTIDVIYKGRQTGVVGIQDHKGKVMQAQTKKKVSQSVRGAIWHHYNDIGGTEEFEDYYERIGKKMASYMPQIIEFLETKS